MVLGNLMLLLNSSGPDNPKMLLYGSRYLAVRYSFCVVSKYRFISSELNCTHFCAFVASVVKGVL